MSLYRAPRSPYWQYDFVWKGHRVHGSTGCTDRREAARYESRQRHQLIERLTGGTPRRPAITLDEAAGLYEDRVGDKPSWPDTERWIGALIAGLGGARLLSEITQPELLRLVARRRAGRGNASVNREIDVWRAMWRWADRARFDTGDMPDWQGLRLPVASNVPRTLSAADEARLFTHLREDLHPFVRFALLSGWRLAEVTRLRWADIDLAAATARTRIKGGDTVQRPLSSAMVALVADQPRVGPFVFTYLAQVSRTTHSASDGRHRTARRVGERYPLSDSGWRKAWTAAITAAELTGFRFHDLRHTRGTRIVRATGNLAAAQSALAHRSIRTTMRYVHMLDEDVRRALDASDDVAPAASVRTFGLATNGK